MASIIEYFSPALWGAWLRAGVDQLGYTAFWLAVGQIIFINVLLSGDNAIVIAMACRGLPEQQRRWGLLIGAGMAALLRIVFTVILASLLTLPFLKLIGGAGLLYIAAKLLVPEEPDRSELEATAHLWRAVAVVAVADIIMSFDNVVAIAAAARGDYLLLAIGLGISIPLLVVGAALMAALLDRFPILIWLGAALLGWIAGETMATDPAVASRLAPLGETALRQVEFAGAAAGAMLAVAAGGLWQRLQETRAHSRPNKNRAKAVLISKFFQIGATQR
ncbi:MAG: TerC family protein [Rhizobiales bacterium]|nr:TerC family protein [Hyphomicrobiales bacterium]